MMSEYPLSLKISLKILLFTVYKHLNIFKAELLRFAAVVRNIQHRQHFYFFSFKPENFLYPVIRYKTTYALYPLFFYPLFFILGNTPIPIS